MTNDPVLAKCLTWTNSGISFIISIVNIQMFAELLEPLFRHNNVSLYSLHVRWSMFRHAALFSFGSRTHFRI